MAIKAEIATVQFGPFSIEGLMSQDGDFGVAVPQAVALNIVPPERSQKQLKALVGQGFPSHGLQKWTTPLNSKPVNVLTLDAFQALIRAMDKRGNEQATVFVDALFGLSLEQLFSDAFGQKFEAEDRQRSLTTRLATKHDFGPLTDQLKLHGFSQPREYARFVWMFQAKLGIESGTRDQVDIQTLTKLQGAQVRLTTLMECGHSPWEALRRM